MYRPYMRSVDVFNYLRCVQLAALLVVSFPRMLSLYPFCLRPHPLPRHER